MFNIQNFLILLYILIGLIVSLVWFFYFNKINFFSKKKTKYALLAFIFGLVSVPIVVYLNNSIDSIILKVLIEEITKLFFFSIFLITFKKLFKEPYDYVFYIAMLAIGFSVLENFLKFNVNITKNYFFDTYIITRAIFGPLGHISYGVITVYGLIKFKFFDSNKNILTIIRFIFIAIILHCFYNIVVSVEAQKFLDIGFNFNSFKSKSLAEDSKYFHIEWALIIICLFNFLLCSIFSTMVNNALNNSKNFNYSEIKNQDSILLKLLSAYASLFIIQFIVYIIIHYTELNSSDKDISNLAQLEFVKTSFKIVLFAFTIVVILFKLSRFLFLKDSWKTIKFELPFHLFKEGYFIKIKGNTDQEIKISTYLQKFFYLTPINYRKTFFKKLSDRVFLEKKIIDSDWNTYFLIKIYEGPKIDDFNYYILKSIKINNQKNYPLVKVFKINNADEIIDIQNNFNNFKLLDLAYVKG